MGAVFSAAISLMAAAQTPPEDPPADSDTPAPKAASKNHGGKPNSKPGADKDADKAAPAIDRSLLPAPKGGDTIYMKGAAGAAGSELSGVQVLRETPKHYEVQVIEGEPPLLVPRSQVDHVDYDDIDPVRDELRDKLFPQPKEVTIASGERVTSDLRDKLMAPITSEKKSYKDLDFASILDEVKTMAKVNLQIDPSVQAKPAAQRRWTIDITPDKTLMTILRTDLVKKFDFVEVVFETDGIIVMTKEAAKKRAAAAAAAKEAPAATPETAPASGEKAAAPPAAPKRP
jgi:hypothetical protein